MEKLMNGGNQICTVNNKLNLNKMIKINSVENIKQTFDDANFTELAVRLEMFENLKMYADAEVLKNLPESFDSDYVIDGKKQTIFIEWDGNNMIHLSTDKGCMGTIALLLSNYVTITDMGEHTYQFDCKSFGNYIEYALRYLKRFGTSISNIEGIIDVIAVAEAPDMDVNELNRTASYVVITK